MSLHVIELNDAGEARNRAGTFLTARPIEHNLLLTILGHSIEFALPGTFWLVVDGSEVVGFALESPPGMGAVLAPMTKDASRLLAETIEIPLPYASGEAGTVAAFAGHLTECRSSAVKLIAGSRLYELTDLRYAATASGAFRLAAPGDRSTLVEWTREFMRELHNSHETPETIVDLRLSRDQFWVWEHDGLVSMAAVSLPEAGVVRVQYVYTPPERRGLGYATGCVEHMSRVQVDRGLRCVLYTDIGNPTANSIYRNIGYEAVGEILGYEFA